MSLINEKTRKSPEKPTEGEVSMTESASSVESKMGRSTISTNSVVFRSMSEDYYGDDTIHIEWLYTGRGFIVRGNGEIWIVPLNKDKTPCRSVDPLKINLSRWDTRLRDSVSIETNVKEIEEATRDIPKTGALYVAEYRDVFKKDDYKVLHDKEVVHATSLPFCLHKEKRPFSVLLPDVSNDDGLVVLGSGSDSEPELLDFSELEEPLKELTLSEDGEDTIIVMPQSDLKKMEDSNRANNDTLCFFIDQYKNDLLELTKCNETLKQSLAAEEENAESYCAEVKRLKEEHQVNQRSMSSREKIFQKLYRNLGRDLEVQQKKSAKFEEEASLLAVQVENLKCVADAQTATKNLLLTELETLKEEKANLTRELRKAEEEIQRMLDNLAVSGTNEGRIDAAVTDGIRSYIASLKPELDDIYELRHENEYLKKVNADLQKRLATQCNRENGRKAPMLATAADSPAVLEMEDRVQDLLKRLRTAKMEYITLYKENKRKEKALENICNWASLAKNGMSLEAPIPPTLPTSNVKSPKRLFSPEDSDAPVNSKDDEKDVKSLAKGLNQKDTYVSSNDDNIDMSSDNQFMLPLIKRRIAVRRMPALPISAGPSTSSSRRAVKILRRRNKSQERIRSQPLQVKREIPSLGWSINPRPVPIMENACSSDGASAAPLISFRSDPVQPNLVPLSPIATAPNPIVGSNTYSAVGLLSDVESDNSDEEVKSNLNPNVCPLCVTSIMDYEAHMRDAHQKQPCPICGYIFDTSVPLYVITYHIERHLEENPDGPSTQVS